MGSIHHGLFARAFKRGAPPRRVLAKLFRSVTSVVLVASSIAVVPTPVAYAATPGYYIAGDGSGGGASGDYGTDYGKAPTGGAGGGSSDTVTGTAGDDVIFGDGSGGGGGGSRWRDGAGGAGGGGADTIDADSGDDIVFGDGFNGGTRGYVDGGNGGFGGGGGGGGAYNTNGNGGTGGLLGGGGGAPTGKTPGASQYGGVSGGLPSKPAGGDGPDTYWGGLSATPTAGSGWFTDQSIGGSGYNCWGAAGGAGFGGTNSAYQSIASGVWRYANAGWGDGNNGYAGSTTPVHWDDSTGALWSYVYGQRSTIFSTSLGTTSGVGAGADSIDGGEGSDQLYGLGGNDTFVFNRDEAGSSDVDTIWDFNRLSETDKLSLYAGGSLIYPSARNALIAAQTTSGSDRSIVFSDGGSHSVTITVKNIGRDLVAADFNVVAGAAPTVVTSAVSDITSTTATGGGNVTSEGSSTLAAQGVCWGTSANPSTADSKTTEATGTGSFTSSITGLVRNTRYYVRAYATNEFDTSYGSNVSFYFDTGAPSTTASGLAGGPNEGWRSTPPTMTLEATDTLSGVALTQYAIDGADWTTYTAPTAIGGADGSHAVTYRSTDASGNVETTHTAYANLDTVAPALTTTPSPGAWQRSVPVTIGASAVDTMSGLAGIRYATNGGAVASYTAGIGVSAQGTTTLTFDAIDVASNQSATQTVVVGVDSLAPTTTATSLADNPGDVWHTSSPIGFTLSATDTVSGVVATTYTVDAGAAQLYAGGAVLVGGEGTHVIRYNSADVAGNVETTHTGYICIDSHSPTTTLSGATSGVWRNGNASIALTATDTVSGVDHTYYTVNGGAVATYTAPWDVSDEGTTTIGYLSVDEAGNVETTHTATVLIDKTAPASEATGPVGWVSSPATVTIESTDTVSGVAHKFYKLNGSATSTYTGPVSVTYDGTTTVSYWAVDEAGNVEATKTLNVRVSTGPVTTIGLEPSTWTSGDVTVTIEATGPVAVDSLKWRAGAGTLATYTAPFRITDEGATVISAVATDTNGSSKGETSATVRIDRTPPNTSDDHVAEYIASATIHLSVADTLSGPDYTRYILDESAPATGTVVTCGTLGSHTLQYLSTDAAGNTEGTKTVTFAVGAKTVYRTSMALTGSSRIRKGRRYTVTATMSPRSASGSVRLVIQRYKRGRWRTEKTKSVSLTAGRGTYRFTPGYRGSWRILGSYSRTETAIAVYRPSSGAKRFRVY